jgi:hypothetical protein
MVIQCVFLNSCVHHYIRPASSTSQNCGLSYFIFDDIASLAGSANVRDVDPQLLIRICKGLKEWNQYCADLRFLGVEAQAQAAGITAIPRMTDQEPHLDVCSVVNNRQTGKMMLQVKTNSVSDINMDSENIEPLSFPLLFPSGERGYTNASKGCINPDGYAMARLLIPEKNVPDYLTAQAPETNGSDYLTAQA